MQITYSRFLGVFILLSLLIFGCTSYGNKQITDDASLAKIQVGVSTKEDVRATFGQPNKFWFTDNDEEVWEYINIRGQTRATSFIPYIGGAIGGADTKTHTLTVRFTKEGVVKAMGRGEAKGGGGSVFD